MGQLSLRPQSGLAKTSRSKVSFVANATAKTGECFARQVQRLDRKRFSHAEPPAESRQFGMGDGRHQWPRGCSAVQTSSGQSLDGPIQPTLGPLTIESPNPTPPSRSAAA